MNLHQLKNLKHRITPWLNPLQWTRSFLAVKFHYLWSPEEVIQRNSSKSNGWGPQGRQDGTVGKSVSPQVWWLEFHPPNPHGGENHSYKLSSDLCERMDGACTHITSCSLRILCAADYVLSISITFFIVCGSHLTLKSVLFGHFPERVYGSIPLGRTTVSEKTRENTPLTHGLSDGHETHPTAIEC